MVKKLAWSKFGSLFVLLFLLVAPLPAPASAVKPDYTEFIVYNTADLPDVAQNSVCDVDHTVIDGLDCTLRAALDEANLCTYALCGEYVQITLPAGTFTLTRAGRDEDHNSTGDLDIFLNKTDVTLIIQGAGAGKTIIDGDGLDRVFHTMYLNTRVRISDLTIRGGRLEQTSDAAANQLGGGVYHSNGSLELDYVIIEDNTIVCLPAVTPSECWKGKGGGISGYGTLNILSSTIRDNYASSGGGIHYNGPGGLKIMSSTLNGNTADSGGAILTYGPMVVYNSTISGNSAADVGGISVSQNTTKLVNVTITDNTSGTQTANLQNISTVLVRNSIIANPKSSGGGSVHNCGNYATWTSSGYNIASDASCFLTATGDLPSTNPKLTPLAWLGGSTQTHGLLAGSPAINARGTVCTDFDTYAVVIDQRGVNRGDGNCDLGAYEGTAYNNYLPVISR
jgi:hypothetical protein